MSIPSNNSIRDASIVTLSVLSWQFAGLTAEANPTGGIPTQGSATISTSGNIETISTGSAYTSINWNSFNIGAGETTTFVEPSSSSVVWNNINGSGGASQILGNLNANGYVILQNASGFYVGGQAAVTAHGLIMTTASANVPNLASGGAWEFNAPPPTAQIINYGKLNITGGGSAFLIADNIQNFGTISAEQGKIGLYAGEKVLVSMSPDGRGLSAQVTLPQGSVDNEGNLVADGGTIAAQAQTVNQNGLVQANTVQNINGEIELVASDNLNIGPNSDIEANGDATTGNPSEGGFVVLQSGNTYADTPTSTINVAGQNGGQGGIVEIFGNGTVQSAINNSLAMAINPYDITISDFSTDPGGLNFSVFDLANYSTIDLRALDNIEITTDFSLTDPGVPASLSLQAGNSIILDPNADINAGHNWDVNLTAGTGFNPTTSQSAPVSGNDGIYLGDGAFIETQDGDINLWAANEILIANDSSPGFEGIRTLKGGNINVATEFGDVNTGDNAAGYLYSSKTAPFYTVNTVLGGISTVAGGNVTINAGGNVYSYLPGAGDTSDAGTGAFGSQAGNVTITAGGSVYGHYVVANGIGSITVGQDAGGVDNPFALSLINGGWTVNAPNGNIFLQEVRNPNGVFNNTTISRSNLGGQHLFNYGPQDYVDLIAGNSVVLTGQNVPRPDGAVPVLYPSILNITAGAGGVSIENDVTLFPSPNQGLTITTTDGGDLTSGFQTELLMSDSGQTRWTSNGTFTDTDHGGLSSEPTGPNPVQIDVSGNMEDLTLITTKATDINVAGNMLNCNFSGQNLHPSDKTVINVAGQIFDQSAYAFANGVTIPSVPSTDLIPGVANSWSAIFTLALNPAALASVVIQPGTSPSQYLADILQQASLFGVTVNGSGQFVGNGTQGFNYNPATGQLSFGGPMPQSLLSALSGPITVLHLVNGQPVLGADGHFETDTVSWAPPVQLQALFAASQNNPSPAIVAAGFRIGGPGEFDINAGSISLGNSYGILSCGVAEPEGGFNRYNNLASITPEGATVNVTVAGDLDMLTSTIATLGGGDVNVTSTGGAMDLGTQEQFLQGRQVGFGIFSSGEGNVSLTALGDINIDGSRVASYDGGNISIESLMGNVDVGSGGNSLTGTFFTYVNPQTGLASSYAQMVFGSGIVANTLVPGKLSDGYPPTGVPVATDPGNINVETPRGNITSSLGGITQVSLSGNTAPGPTITLSAGTFPSDGSSGYAGNVDLGQSGVIGGSVNVSANGNITGLIISRQNSQVNAAQNFSGSVLAGGSADVTGGGSVSGIIVGVGGASVSGGNVTADVLSQNASVNGGASQSTLGASATASSASQSAAQQASSDAKELAGTDEGSDDDKKKKKNQPLMQRVKRVTVILPKT